MKGGKKAAKRNFKAVSWKTVVEEKEKHVTPLNLNIDLKRLT